MTGIIYGLCGPEGIRYVGKTERELDMRMAQHRSEARRGRRTHLYNWWRSLDADPVVVELARCSPERLSEAEIAWISFFRSAGVDLCNHTEGGQGGKPTPELRERLSVAAQTRAKDPEYRAKLTEANKKRWSDPAERAAASVRAVERFARPDYREKMSAVCTERYRDPAQRERQRLSTKASWERMTPAEREARCAAMRRGRAERRAAA